MVFSSVIFIFYFLPVFLIGYYVSGWRAGALLLGSAVFYVWGEGGYVFLLLMAPLGLILYKTFEDGLAPPLDAITSPDGLHALKLTLIMVAIAVPLNTIFGVGCALLIGLTTPVFALASWLDGRRRARPGRKAGG